MGKTRGGMAVFAIINGLPEEKIILVHDKHKPPPPMWKLPGGKVEPWESPEIALYRELNEEIGINILPLTDKDVIFEKDLGTHIFRVYKVIYHSGQITPYQEEIERLNLFSEKDIRQMLLDKKILPKHGAAITEYLHL